MHLNKQKRYNVLLEMLLTFIAISLLIACGVIRFIYGFFGYLFRGDLKNLGYFLRKINIGLDEAGNTIGGPFNNRFMRAKGGYKFGRSDETLSSALGKNERDGTLRWMGRVLVKLLNKLDYNHSIKSIEDFSGEHTDGNTNSSNMMTDPNSANTNSKKVLTK